MQSWPGKFQSIAGDSSNRLISEANAPANFICLEVMEESMAMCLSTTDYHVRLRKTARIVHILVFRTSPFEVF